MIVYKTGDWWKALWHFHTSSVILLLLRRVALVGVYNLIIALVVLKYHFLSIQIGREYFSFLGIMLSLLLVFRTNTAYDRYYEGRRLWGQLVSHCRGLAMELNAILPRHAIRSRLYYAALISNFPLALKGALRNGVQFEQLEATPDIMDRLQSAESVTTCLVAVLQESIEQLRQAQIIDPIHLMTIKPHLLGMMEVNGSCERIKTTPIPFSYSFFIKMFITLFIGIMPIVLVDTCGYLMIPITMVGAYVMLGLEMIGEEIEQPFGTDSNDLPITQLANKIRVSVHDVLGVELPHFKKALAAPPYSVVH
ncbi:bestrophin family protein [Hymenobacter yonginensis]|jgi:putative membrane protein|uniref:Bestrophin family ion channel n=1 Tax=Hymenobacter yonginensis TaxID=748197 RepID=A0ABY7PMK3_9BACT|nr:bestrophin family ion channel [Hymenobacter yonginensis]WBO83904.1 bestrophin family ion channel [Hymenobacter yonginensis]